MEIKNILLLVIVSIGAIALIIFLVNRNRNDITVMNPDAEEKTEEVHKDQDRRKDSM